MIPTKGVYHIGIPADDVERAGKFYTEVLGMKLVTREVTGDPNEHTSMYKGRGPILLRLLCGRDEVVIFERPQPIRKDRLKEDGITHQAFKVPLEYYDDTVKHLKEIGAFRDAVDWESGRAVYFLDSEGNYMQLHFSEKHRDSA